jgi:hypothetical protein
VPTRRILHTRPICSRCTCNKDKINPEYTIYSQDLPDWEIYFLTLKDYDRLYGLWVFLFAKSSTKSVSLIPRLLEAVFYLLTNILCKHLVYDQARVEQIMTISPSFHCQFLLRCQSVVKPYRHAEMTICESMCPAGYPKKHTPRLYPQYKQDQPIPLLSRVFRSPSKLGLLAPVLEARPQCGAKTSTYPRLQSVGPERVGAHDKRVTSLPIPISKYVLGIINL